RKTPGPLRGNTSALCSKRFRRIQKVNAGGRGPCAGAAPDNPGEQKEKSTGASPVQRLTTSEESGTTQSLTGVSLIAARIRRRRIGPTRYGNARPRPANTQSPIASGLAHRMLHSPSDNTMAWRSEERRVGTV